MKRSRTVTVLVLLATLATPSTAAAGPTPAPPAVAAYLAAYPGGVALNDNEISYDGGRFVVTLTAPQGLAAVDCPSGWFCFYERTNYGYPRGKLSSCGWQSLATWGWQDRIQSAYYNLSRGSALFTDYSNAIFQVGVGYRGVPDVHPYRNLATHVFRYC